MTLTAIIQDVAKRRERFEKALRGGTLSAPDALALSEQYAFVYKDGPSPVLGMGRGDAAQPQYANDDDGSIPFIITTTDEDRDGDVVYSPGYRGQNYAKNPCWFLGHQEWVVPIGTSRGPDGRIAVYPEENRVRSICYFDRADPDADFVYGKCKRGILNATSVAFVPIEAYRREHEEKARTHSQAAMPPGWFFKVWDHTETSIVGVPSNAGAIRDSLDQEKSFISPRVRKALQPFAATAQGCWNGWCPCPPCENKSVVLPTPASARKALPTSPIRLRAEKGESPARIQEGGSQPSGVQPPPSPPSGTEVPAALTGAPIPQSTPMPKKKPAAKGACCKACDAGKKCACAKGKRSVAKATQADMESTYQVPGARTGQPQPKAQPSDDIAPEKACQILQDGSINGQPLTDEQRRLFGAACAQAKSFQSWVKQVQDNPVLATRLQESLHSVTGAGTVGRGLTETAGTAGGYSVGQDETETPGFTGCLVCAGTGNCTRCDGRGVIDEGDCPECDGGGECADCGGAGNIVKSNGTTPMKTITTKAQDEEDKEDVTDQDSATGSTPAQENKDAVDEPFNPKPSARVAAQLFQHYKDGLDWLDGQLKDMDHPGMTEWMTAHKDHLQGAMDHLNEGLAANHPDHDMDKILKALEVDTGGSGKLETGEANKVDAGQVPPDPEDKSAVDEPTKPDLDLAKNAQGSVDSDTEEILERYRNPQTGKMVNRKVGTLRRAADGKSYIVWDKALTDAGREQRTGGSGKPLADTGHEERTGGSGSPLSAGAGEQADRAANSKHGEYIVGSGTVDWGKKAKAYQGSITKAASHLKHLSAAPDLPEHHQAGLLYHSGELTKVCQDIEVCSQEPAAVAAAPKPEVKQQGAFSAKALKEVQDFGRLLRQYTGHSFNGAR